MIKFVAPPPDENHVSLRVISFSTLILHLPYIEIVLPEIINYILVSNRHNTPLLLTDNIKYLNPSINRETNVCQCNV